MMCRLLFSVLCTVAAVAPVGAQAVGVTATPANPPLDGRATFDSYCATCHGRDGSGNGPLASSLKVPPADLTTLSARSDDVFPADIVRELITHGRDDAPAHGTSDMPIWGPIFSTLESSDQVVERRIANLVAYLESMQTE